MCEHVGNLMSLMKFLLWRKSWKGNLWVLLNLQLSTTPASPSNPTLRENCALSVLAAQLHEWGTAATWHSPHCLHMKGHATPCLCCVTPWCLVPWAGWRSVWSQAEQSLCCLLGKDDQKKGRGDFSSSFGWVTYKVSRVYWILGCFCICFNLHLADMGRLGCWSLLLEVPVSVRVSLNCPFMEEREAGACRGAPCHEAAQHGQLHSVPGTGLSVTKQDQCWAARFCRSPCLCRALKSWTCS